MLKSSAPKFSALAVHLRALWLRWTYRPGRWNRKPWGWTRRVVSSPQMELHELVIEPGGFCSIHYHERKIQQLTVVSGELILRGCNTTGKTEQEWIVRPGMVMAVMANVRHQFESRTGAVCVEQYGPICGGTVDPNDIVRLSEGGKRDINEF